MNIKKLLRKCPPHVLGYVCILILFEHYIVQLFRKQKTNTTDNNRGEESVGKIISIDPNYSAKDNENFKVFVATLEKTAERFFTQGRNGSTCIQIKTDAANLKRAEEHIYKKLETYRSVGWFASYNKKGLEFSIIISASDITQKET